MTCIVAYDIEDNKIRAKLSRFLEGKGIRLQKSVFAVEIERHVFTRFTNKIETLTGNHGKIAIFRLCIGCQKNAIKLNDEEKLFYIF